MIKYFLVFLSLSVFSLAAEQCITEKRASRVQVDRDFIPKGVELAAVKKCENVLIAYSQLKEPMQGIFVSDVYVKTSFKGVVEMHKRTSVCFSQEEELDTCTDLGPHESNLVSMPMLKAIKSIYTDLRALPKKREENIKNRFPLWERYFSDSVEVFLKALKESSKDIGIGSVVKYRDSFLVEVSWGSKSWAIKAKLKKNDFKFLSVSQNI